MDSPLPDPDIAAAHATASDLRVLAGQLRRRLRDKAKTGDLPEPQLAAIFRLMRDGPATVTALAQAEGVRPQSMGATVAALAAAGLVSGAPDPADGRQTVLSLTDSCRELIQASRTAKEDWLFGLIRSRLTATEQQELARGVQLINRLLES